MRSSTIQFDTMRAAGDGARRSLAAAIRERARTLPLLRRGKRALAALGRPLDPDYRASDIAQASLVASWRQLHAQGVVLPLDQVGFSRFSEFEEDGMLLYLLTLAGTTNRTVVEISAQDGRTCMATNLVVHHRWQGFLFDGDPLFVADGRRFFARHPATRARPPRFESRWFTRENVNATLADLGVPAEVDLLSLDIDGNDLHLWEALTATRPRMLICEFNNAVPSDRALTVPYRADFDFRALPEEASLFRSASLEAYIRVSRRKGYRFVGMHTLGFNAVFLRDDVLAAEFPERPASDLDANPCAREMREAWWPRLSAMPWHSVDAEGRL